MRYTLLLFLTSIHLFALNIYLNSAKERGLPYAVLHIIDSEKVECHTIPLALDKKEYICKFKKMVKNRITEKKLKLVNIDFLEKKREFYIKIDPKFNSNIFPLNEKLYETKEVVDEKMTTKSKHWIVLLYEKSPFERETKTEGINFPVTYDKYLKPFVGAVDLNGAPISYVKSKDINYYLDIQKEFDEKDFDSVVKDVDRVLKQYPNSIFKSDLLLYKLRAIDISLEKNISPLSDRYENSDVIKMAKQWIRVFSSNESIPQALLVLVKSYIRAQSSSDVNYFLDIMVSEHKNSPYTKKAILYFADSLYNKNDKNRAMKLYEDVLYSAKDLDIASLAAIRLANSKINAGKAQEAKEYLTKVLDANRAYLLKDRDATSKLAAKLAANGLEKIAATLNDLLLKNLPKGELDTKELLLKQAGDWYAKAGEISRAYERYKEYKKEYKDGIYIDEVNRAIDRLFFKLKETNETKLANYYDMLISKYNNDIKDRAILAKAKLLFKQKKYQNILEMKDLLQTAVDKNSTKTDTFVKRAAIMLIDEYIKNQDCQKAVDLFEENSIKFVDIDDKKRLFDCFTVTLRYKKAQKLAKQELKSKDLNIKFQWLQNLIISDYKLRKFDKVLELKSDLYKFSTIIKKPIKASVYRAIFNSLIYKKQYNQALSILRELEIKSPKDIKNIELYYKIAEYANSTRDDLLLVKYIKKILFLQKIYKINYYTPKIDFLYIDSLKRLSKLDEAKKVANALIKLKLKERYRYRALYELGEISLKLKENQEAKKWFTECSKTENPNSWSTLCKESLKIF